MVLQVDRVHLLLSVLHVFPMLRRQASDPFPHEPRKTGDGRAQRMTFSFAHLVAID